MSTVDVTISGDSDAVVLPVSVTDAIAAMQVYVAQMQVIQQQIQQTSLAVAEYAAMASAAANAAATNAVNTYLTTLPTALPASPGVVWNNGGVVSVSQ